jgi:predicted dehydrogenase
MTKKMKNNRREFIKKTAAATAGITVGLNSFSPINAKGIMGANDRIRMGFIGLGNRGSQLLNWFMENKDVEIGALCDVYEPYALRDRTKVDRRWIDTGKVPNMGEDIGREVKRYSDYRRLLEQKDLDAVCIATPDHWHALIFKDACEAGKDVYVEKPLTITLQEGRSMVDIQKRTGRVVAVGLNRRGSTTYQKLAKEIQAGKIGKVLSANAFRISNMYPNGIGNLKGETPPAGFDWDMWLGPRASRPYQYNIAPYYFRWWSDYSSQMGNWGVHYMDVIRWMMGEQAPIAISAHGGKYALKDDRTIPDTMDVIFEFASGANLRFSIYEASNGSNVKGGEVELRGTKGVLLADQDQYSVLPSKPGQFQHGVKLIEPEEYKLKSDTSFGDLGIKENSTGRLIRNFLDCVKSRKEPWCPIEEGHRSTSFAHLANIALATKQRLEWDPVAEQITNNPKANDLLHYEYRNPWKL